LTPVFGEVFKYLKEVFVTTLPAAFAFDYLLGNRVTGKVVGFGGALNHDADTGIFHKQFTVAEFFVLATR